MLGNDRLGGVLIFETHPHAQVPHHLARVLDVFQHTPRQHRHAVEFFCGTTRQKPEKTP